MKDAEFIELLNLYLDHEITPADAARLEAEVLANPARREVYRDYCRIQKGCKLLAREFATETSSVGDGKVVAFEPIARVGGRRLNATVMGVFAAAAACVALVFIVSNEPAEIGAGAAQQTVAQQETVTRTEKVAIMPAASPTERRIGRTVTIPETLDAQPTFVNAITLAGKPSSPSSSSLLLANDPNGAQFEWINSMQLAPVQRVSIDAFRLEGRTPAPVREQPALAPGSQQGGMEWTAIRWTR